MFVHAAQAMGYRTAVLDLDLHSPAGAVSHLHVRGDYLDEDSLSLMQRRCAAVTTEFENVPAAALARLASARPVAPGADAVAVCQHRRHEKEISSPCGVPCAPHAFLAAQAGLDRVDAALFPGILKTARLGYDGKGQVERGHADELAAAWRAWAAWPACSRSAAAAARDQRDRRARRRRAVVHLPVQQNLHRDGILAVTQAPAPGVPTGRAGGGHGRRAALERLLYVGVLCVEFFVLDDGTLVANEMAPRPHNTGHYSIDACDVSQFELQVRAWPACRWRHRASTPRR